MHRYLETERLALRRFTESDVDDLCALDSDPAVMRFISGGAATPREVIQARVLPWFMSFYTQGEALGFWAALEKASGDFIGWFGLHPEAGRDPGDLALGYRLRKTSWRKGYSMAGKGKVAKVCSPDGSEYRKSTHLGPSDGPVMVRVVGIEPTLLVGTGF